MFRILTILLASCSLVFGFDPGGPPLKKTLLETCRYLSNVVIPTVSFSEATLDETVEFFELDKPKEYRLTYKIDDTLRDSGKRFTMDAKDVTYLEVIAALAEQMDADIVLSAGQVTFTARKDVRKQQPAEPKARWFRENTLTITGDAIVLDKCPVWFLDGKKFHSASDGGFYTYRGTVSFADG